MTVSALMRVFCICLAVGAAVGVPAAVAAALRPVLRRRYSAAGCSALWTGLCSLLVLPPVAAVLLSVGGMAAADNGLPAAPQAVSVGVVSVRTEPERTEAAGIRLTQPPPFAAENGTGPEAFDLSASPAIPQFSFSAKKIPSLPAGLLPALRIAAHIWCAGALMGLALTGVRQLCWRRRCIRWQCPLPAGTAAVYAAVCAQLGVRRAPRLMCTRWVKAPMLTGVLRPVLLLPAAHRQREELVCIFTHELLHLRRRDLFRSQLLCAAQLLHWYHPAAWLLSNAVRCDTEQATDAAALALLSAENAPALFRRCGENYGDVLLRSVRTCAVPLPGIGFAVTKKELKERIGRLFDRTPRRRAVLPVCLLLCVLLPAALFAGCTAAALQVPPASAAETAKIGNTAAGTQPLYWPVPDYCMISARFADCGGMDLECARGAAVTAVADGVVLAAVHEPDTAQGYGSWLELDHGGGITTLYAHCLELLVQPGDTVHAGQRIAVAGNTGTISNKCHFEYRVDGVPQDPFTLEWQGILLTEYMTQPLWIPVSGVGYITQKYSEETPWMDIILAPGAKACAVAPGIVTKADPKTDCIEIDHGGGITARYTGVQPIDWIITEDQTVIRGVSLGTAEGSYRFELFRNGKSIDLAPYLSDNAWSMYQAILSDEMKRAVTEECRVWPVPEYAYLSHGFEGETAHTGLDIAAALGEDILAVWDGTVVTAQYGNSGYGNYVIIDHGDGLTTLYSHCSELRVKQGDAVCAGQCIATVGSSGNSTGSHCHFEVRENGAAVDPAAYIDIPML